MYCSVTVCTLLLQPISPCGFDDTSAINVDETSEMSPQSSRFGFYLVNLGTTVITTVITASLAINVEDVSLLYVANSGVIEVVS